VIQHHRDRDQTKTPVIDAGEDATVGEGVMVEIDGSAKDDGKIVDVEWQYDPEVESHITKDPADPLMLHFHTPNLAAGEKARGYIFRLIVEDDKSNISTDSCLITVTKDGQLPPPTPTPTGVLYDSNVNGGWNNGKKRIVKSSEGNVGPDGKGLYTAASGSPELHIDGDGVAHLVAGSGGVANISLKLRSRHQEGSACENRAGGEGVGIDHSGWDIKRETCHNIHDSIGNGSLDKGIKDYEWNKAEFTCQDEGSNKIRLTMSINGKKQADVVDSNAEKYFFDKALLEKNSYFWIRLNNSAHGRIYIMAKNYNSKLTLDFMFEPKENSIALRNVLLEKI